MTVTSRTVRARLRRWLVLPTALASILAAVLSGAAPAQAYTNCNLWFYYNFFGSPTWSHEAVGNYMSCSVRPAIVRTNDGTEIATVANDKSAFLTYLNQDGSPAWYKNDGWGGVNSSFGAPSMTPYSGGTEMAITYGGELISAWEPYGQSVQSGGGSAGVSSGIGPWAPGMTRTSGASEIAAAGADGTLWFYWNIDGSPTWNPEKVAGPWMATDSPALMTWGGATQVAAIAADGSLNFYWVNNGTSTWHPEQVAAPEPASGAPAMTDSNGAVEIAVAGLDGSLWFYWAANYTNTWHAEEVAGPGSVSGSPTMVGANNGMEIAATAPNGSLWFYWATNGTTTWHPQQVAVPGTTATAPAMVASGNAIEIAVEGP
jgi:hypothetical protein